MPTVSRRNLSQKTADDRRWRLEQKRSVLVALLRRSGVDAGTREAWQHKMLDIDRALASLADGTYGTCDACGGDVGQLRLKMIPEARLCLLCEFP